MKTVSFLILCFFICLVVVSSSCRKKNEVDCNAFAQARTVIETMESVGDTLLKTDTAYTNRRVYFQTKNEYKDIQWVVGVDPRTFTSSLFSLVFNTNETINVSLKANETTLCGGYERIGSKQLTIVPGDGTVISPLAGKYRGYILGKQFEPFDVEIKFWKAPKYTWASEGFYSIHNLPKGFRDTTREINGVRCPELDGVDCFPGYHNMAYNTQGNIFTMGLKGTASISRNLKDTLHLSFKTFDTALYRQTGKLVYFNQSFIGIKY